MAIGIYDITVTKGTDFSLGMTLTDSNSAAINVTNYTFKSEIRRKASTGIDATFTITKTNAAAGAIKLALTQAQTQDLPVGKLKYDLLAHDGTEVSQYIKGTVTVVDTVTDGISL
jgi:hypothetical protein|tara:strand:- start:1698 stop:2042 length:345 start_codon:yes stop_codon:yes gene_type:complete